jgi:hypothetical protein
VLGYEPPEPKLWKAIVGAGLITFPLLYLLDAAVLHRRPGWPYLLIASAITLLFGRQMYSYGPQSLQSLWPTRGPRTGSWRPPERHGHKDPD